MTYIDSRELLEELRTLLAEPSYSYEEDPTDEAYAESWNVLDVDERERVTTLRDVLQELPESTVDGRNSWGVTMVPEDEFEDYARQTAEDIGAITGSETWPCNCIDWERAARELAMDYASIEFDGVTYLCR